MSGGRHKAVTTLAPLSPNTLLFISKKKKASNILLEGGVRASRHRVKRLEMGTVVVGSGDQSEGEPYGVTVAASRGSERGRNLLSGGWAWRNRPGYTHCICQNTDVRAGARPGVALACTQTANSPPLCTHMAYFAEGLKDLGGEYKNCTCSVILIMFY